jgi:glutathione synthase/RimK-type ligase-like ATP-grasp enzyme
MADVADELVMRYGNVVHKNLSEGDSRSHLLTCGASRGNAYETLGPAILQEMIRAESEYRIYVMGESVIAVAIDRRGKVVPGDIRANYRRREGVAITSSLDEQLEEIRNLVSELGLVFGVVDCMPTSDGLCVFEINPNGTWHWLPETVSREIQQGFERCIVECLAS